MSVRLYRVLIFRGGAGLRFQTSGQYGKSRIYQIILNAFGEIHEIWSG